MRRTLARIAAERRLPYHTRPEASVGTDARAAGCASAPNCVAAGTPIGAYDILIAGQAVRSGATLVTADSREFARVRGLAWEDWTISAGP